METTASALNIDSIKEVMDGFDPGAMMPELGSVIGWVLKLCRVAVLVGPVVMLALGLIYLFLAPKEANYYLGYRCYYGMGSEKAWQFTQRLAGLIFTALGGVLLLIMALLAIGFGSMQPMAMVWRTVRCLIWQAVLAIIATAGINGLCAYWFTRRGEVRKGKTPMVPKVPKLKK